MADSPRNPPRQSDADRRALRMIRTGGLDHRRGGWRFGTARVADDAVERLAARGRAIIHAGRCIPAPAGARDDGASR